METHIKRQAIRHDCLPRCWAMGSHKVNKYAVWKNLLYHGLDQSRQDKNLVHWHSEPSEPTKEGPLSFLLQKSPFASVSTVSRGHPSLVSLDLSKGAMSGEYIKRGPCYFVVVLVSSNPAFPSSC
jgi:hypothetical protein